ncbi:MAG: PrsW family intramembrane metalloprotease [Methanomicrobiales archaeon]|nr:PrsW family intramembrane metalloprotease [Methanomicrobiales archaeon]
MEAAPLLLLVAIAPAVFWLWYFYHKDRYEPEPLAWILMIYILGMAVTIPVALVEGFFALFLTDFFITVMIAPVFEEAGKYLVVRRTVYESSEFDEPVDGIVYAAAAGLGFATLENIIYVFSALETSIAFAIQTGLVRALISVPGHVLFSAMWGYALGRARFLPASRRRGIIFGGLVLAMASHALFNLLLYDTIGFALLVLIVVPALWFIVQRKIDESLRNSVYRPK